MKSAGIIIAALTVLFGAFAYTSTGSNSNPEDLSLAMEVVEVEKPAIPRSIRGIYLTAGTTNSPRFDELVKKLKESNGNAVVIDVEHGGGKLAFRPKNELLKNLNPGSDDLNHLPELIQKLKDQGIYTIARQVIFNDPYMAARKPEWKIKKKWYGHYDKKWLDPSMPGVQNYNLYMMEEVAALGFDEIQLDYIRFPAAAHQVLTYHYDEENFSRSDVINDFLKKARRVADKHQIQLSADVFGAIVWGDTDWRIVGQDPATMADHLDAIYPMTYPSHVSPGYQNFFDPYGNPYNFIHESIKVFEERVAGKADVRTWVQGFPLKIPRFGQWFMQDQVRGTYDAGADDFVIWSPGNIYTYSWPSLGMLPPEPTPETEEVIEPKEDDAI